jgi:endonuclease III
VISRKERKRRVGLITKQAIDRFGELKGRKMRAALDQLVLSMFYHATSVRQATRAFRSVRRNFADWNEVRVSHPAEVAAAVSTARWATEVAERLVWLLGELYEAYNRTNLDFIGELTPAQARSCLVRLPMVPRELADEVLLLSLDVPVLPFSPAVARMCHRLGLIENDKPTLKNQKALARLFEEEHFAPVHLFFCDHAEKYCLEEAPLCDRCPLARACRNGK